MNKQKGFTLIELLVVIAIIGLLATLTVASLNSARSKSRDARRVSDVRQIQTALELYLNDNGEYPLTSAGGTGVDYEAGGCLDGTGFHTEADGCDEPIYLKAVPADPQSDQAYTYTCDDTVDTATPGDSYTIQYTLENIMQGVTNAANQLVYATPIGIHDP